MSVVVNNIIKFPVNRFIRSYLSDFCAGPTLAAALNPSIYNKQAKASSATAK